MSGSPLVQYLEKYSVAPSPSRDYHGIKVFDDKVIFYTWRISHGPHTHPVVLVTRFGDFFQDRTIQDDIKRIFGYPMFRHVEAIVKGRGNTLLTMPKNLIVKLTNYLGIIDVLNLSTLSPIANEVFNAESVWELLYRRQKMGLLYRDERERARIYGWKELFKERQMHKAVKDRKFKKASISLRDSSSASFSAFQRIDWKSKNSGLKSGVEIETEVSFVGGSKTPGQHLATRYLEDAPMAKRPSQIDRKLDSPLANSKKGPLLKATSNDELPRLKFSDRTFSKAQKIDEIHTVGKGFVISKNEDSASKDSARVTSAGDSSGSFSRRDLTIGQRKVPDAIIYHKFPTPRKPASQDHLMNRKFQRVKSIVESNSGDKSLVGMEAKLIEGIPATPKSKGRSLLAESTEKNCCDSLKAKSSSVGSSRQGLANKGKKIKKKPKK